MSLYMKIREHRGTLTDSLLTKRLIPATAEALWEAISAAANMSVKRAKSFTLRIDNPLNDARCDWKHSRVVSLSGLGIVLVIDAAELPPGIENNLPGVPEVLAKCFHHPEMYKCSECGEVAKVSNDRSKLYAIDYDGTITSDVEFYLDLIQRLQERGHQVVIATMRSAEEQNSMDERVLEACPWIVPTNRRAKKAFLKTFGINPDIWIDDTPEFLLVDARPKNDDQA